MTRTCGCRSGTRTPRNNIGDTFGNHAGPEQIRAILHTLRDYFHEMHHYATNIVVKVDPDNPDRATALVDAASRRRTRPVGP